MVRGFDGGCGAGLVRSVPGGAVRGARRRSLRTEISLHTVDVESLFSLLRRLPQTERRRRRQPGWLAPDPRRDVSESAERLEQRRERRGH